MVTAADLAPKQLVDASEPMTVLLIYQSRENHVVKALMSFAQERTRTSMLLRALDPESSVSTNSTTWAAAERTL